MKILLNCYEYPPFVHGGVGSFCRDLAEGLVKNGHNVHVIGIYNPILLNSKKIIIEKINGVQITRIPQSKIKPAQLQVIYDRIRLFYIIRKINIIEKFDLFESPESTGWLPFFVPIRPFVVRLHGAQIFFDTELKRKGSRLGHFFEKLTIKNADCLVSVSNYCGNRTLDLLKINREFKTIYNGVDYEKFQLVMNEVDTKILPNIVFANSVIPKKGVEELLKAFNIIGKEFPDLNLIIIGKSLGLYNGKNNYTKFLNELIDSDLKNRVTFTGWLDKHVDVIKYLATAKVCVYPSHMEGQGIAPTEAMALGRPVIFMENGPGPEVIEDGISGLLVDTTSVLAISEAIRQIIQNTEFANKIGLNAKVRVFEKFNKKRWLIENEIFYQKAITK